MVAKVGGARLSPKLVHEWTVCRANFVGSGALRGDRGSESAVTKMAAAPQAKGKAADAKSVFRVGGIRIEGASLAGMTTSVVVPQFKLAFDVGRCPQRSCFQQTVLISHGHLDHAGGIHFHASTRALLDLPESVFVVPENLEQPMRIMLETAGEMDGHSMPYQIKVLKVGDQLELPGGFFARAFPTVHPVPSQGYVVYSRKKTLKRKYIGLPGPEIRDLKLAGVEITDTVEVAELAFTGDTSAEFLDMETSKEALGAKLLIMEMTFVDDTKDKDGAKEKGHMHIDDLTEYQDKFKVGFLVESKQRLRVLPLLRQLLW